MISLTPVAELIMPFNHKGCHIRNAEYVQVILNEAYRHLRRVSFRIYAASGIQQGRLFVG